MSSMPPKEDGLFHMVAMETWCGYQACLCSTIVTQPWTLIWELESCLHPIAAELWILYHHHHTPWASIASKM